MSVDSKPGRGSTFTFRLPACDPDGAGPDAADARSDEPVAPGARILIMDDEEDIRRLLDRILTAEGYWCHGAACGEAALEFFKRRRDEGEPFDLAILDLTIPGGMGGLRTLEELKSLQPGLPAIVTSGYSSDPVMSDHERYGFAGILRKPFSVEDVRRAIADLRA